MKAGAGLAMLAVALCVIACASPGREADATPRSFILFDQERGRPIPILLYGRSRRPLAVVSHGYGAHAGDLGFLARALVARGYQVAAIEHLERPGDPAMSNAAPLAVTRRPVWAVGAASIGWVIDELGRRGVAEAGRPALLIGYSNGGDMTMLFATLHPDRVSAAVSLDNRRMPLPRTRRPAICSIRSSDLPADPGVLPDAAEARRLGMTIVTVPVRHDAMSDAATPAQQAAMIAALDSCLMPARNETVDS